MSRNAKIISKEEFLKQAKEFHKNKFDYSKADNFKNSRSKIIVICPIHGEFIVGIYTHLKCDCNKCVRERIGKQSRLSIEEFLNKSKIVHKDKYMYDLSTYKHSKCKMRIICKIHGEFFQTPNKHYHGNSCPLCSREKQSQRQFKNNDFFLEKAYSIHKNDYEYLEEYISCTQHIKIKCNICNLIFEQKVAAHLNGCGCPFCKKSKGELSIAKFLTENNIEFIHQHWFLDCRGKKRPLPFDFYLPKQNILIEFDGKQHFELVDYSHGKLTQEEIQQGFNGTIINDNIKTSYCLSNNITLIRIPYWDFKNIPTIMSTSINI